MDLWIIDLESFWSQTHTLKKMPTMEYCMHPETEVISCAFKRVVNCKIPTPTVVVFGEAAVKAHCAKIDWANAMVVAHNNSEFDAIILAWRMGVRPKMWGCTKAMAAPIHAKAPGLSLAKLAQHYGVGRKDNTALVQTKGKHLCDFSPSEIECVREYNKEDVELCYKIFCKLAPQTRKDEMRLIDMTIRMLVEPKFEADTALLYRTLTEENERKRQVLLGAAYIMGFNAVANDDDEAIEFARAALASAPKFTKYLKSLGAEVPMKVSPTTGKEIPALAKTDQAFLDMQYDPNPAVALAAQARLDTKSTLLSKRIEAFLSAASATGGKVPIPLRYYGADTTGRWSGWSYNPQNMPRINPKEPKPSDALRYSLTAPEGFKVVVADQSSIELRINHFLWKEPGSMQLFQDNPGTADLYTDFAANQLYNIIEEEVTKQQRQVGKMAHLGLGFGAAHVTFRQVAKIMGGVDLTEEEARDIVRLWRGIYRRIVAGWYKCDDALRVIARGASGAPIDPWGMIVPTPEGLRTPRGVIRYPSLHAKLNPDTGRDEFVYGYGNRWAKIYSGKVDENVVQHLGRCILADNVLTVQRETGYNPVLLVHDEPVYIAPEDEAEDLLAFVLNVMRSPVSWWPELITWGEGDIADTYGEAK